MMNMQIGTSLKCIACGNDEFFSVDDTGIASKDIAIACSECGLITNKEQLIKDNLHLIDSKISEIENNEYTIIEMMALYPSEPKIKFEILKSNC